MAEIQSTDYHDFVFQEGKLVGEFEQMYRKSAQVPWHQDAGLPSSYSASVPHMAPRSSFVLA